MTVRECYQHIGSYEEAIGRLGSDRLIRKYLGKFCADTSFACLDAALQCQDYHNAFVSVHNMKGLFLNLALTQAAHSATVLCEALRPEQPRDDLDALFADVKRDYEQTIDAIQQLLNDPESEVKQTP